MPKAAIQEWLLIFYSVPSQPVSNRMKIWRKLSKAGAVQLKGAVYILPATEEHEEFLQWLIGEVKSMGGDGAFVRTAEVKTMTEADIRELFLRQAEEGYRGFEKNLDALERKVQSFRKGAQGDEGGKLADLANKLAKELDEHHKRDFFSSPLGVVMQKRMQALDSRTPGDRQGGRGNTGSDKIEKRRRLPGPRLGHSEETLYRSHGIGLAHQTVHRPEGLIPLHRGA